MQTATHTPSQRSGWSILAIVLVGVAALGAFVLALFVAGALFLGVTHVRADSHSDHHGHTLSTPQPAPTATEER